MRQHKELATVSDPAGLGNALAANGLMLKGGAHEIIEQHKPTTSKSHFKAPANHGVKLQQTANRPAGRPRGTHHFRPNENGDRNQRRKANPIHLILCSQCSTVPFIHTAAPMGQTVHL
jgi:hypothetical protein